MAKSLLEALVKAVADASVTFQMLLLLKNNRRRFLELVKITCPVVGEVGRSKVATETEQSLTDRIEEIEEFQATMEKVMTFTRMCDLIHPGENDNVIRLTIIISSGIAAYFAGLNGEFIGIKYMLSLYIYAALSR